MSHNENSKSKDKRLEEKEKLEAELQRSLAAAKVKATHKQIENTEKSRKRATVLSICKRIDNLSHMVSTVVKFLIKNCNITKTKLAILSYRK
jgi:ribosomal protein S20